MINKKMKLFSQLDKGDPFHFGDKPERVLVKQDGTHMVTPAGRKPCHPHVLVFSETPKKRQGIYGADD